LREDDKEGNRQRAAKAFKAEKKDPCPPIRAKKSKKKKEIKKKGEGRGEIVAPRDRTLIVKGQVRK